MCKTLPLLILLKICREISLILKYIVILILRYWINYLLFLRREERLRLLLLFFDFRLFFLVDFLRRRRLVFLRFFPPFMLFKLSTKLPNALEPPSRFLLPPPDDVLHESPILSSDPEHNVLAKFC